MRFIKGNRLQKSQFSEIFAPQAPILGFLEYNPEFPENEGLNDPPIFGADLVRRGGGRLV